MAFELIAFDMDGTLLDSAKKILPSSVDAIDRALLAGKKVAIASGRCPQMISMYRDWIPHVRYAICCAGAVVYDLDEGRTISEVDLDPAFVKKSIEVANAQGEYMIEVTSGTGVLMESREIDMAPECNVGIYQQLYRETSTLVDDARVRATAPGTGVSKLNFHFRDAEARDRTLELVRDENVVMTKCEKSSLEFTAPGVDKGTGLASLCQALGLDMSQAIAVGDADNDLPMLRAAGLGVAMGNANENARAAADVFVADNDHGGVAEAVDRFLLV